MRLPKPKRAAKAPKKPLRRKRKGKRASLARECDRLCGAIVRARGACEGDHHGKGGVLQWAHGFSRKYKAVRWLPINGFCLCRGCHLFYTYNPLDWDVFISRAWGEPTYLELRRTALKNEKQDMPSVLAKLREEASRLGIE